MRQHGSDGTERNAAQSGGDQQFPAFFGSCANSPWSSFYRNVYMGGAIRLALIAQAAASTMPPPPGIKLPAIWADTLLHPPLTTMEQAISWPMPWLTGILAQPNPDGYWKRLDITKDIESMDIPAQHIAGYYDFFSREEV